MKTIVFYEVATGGMPKALMHFSAHKARLKEFHARGGLLMAGPYANPMEGAMAIFADRATAEEFIKGDPFVVHGVVATPTLKDWNEVLT